MAFLQKKNNAIGYLESAVSAVDTFFTLRAGDATKFPTVGDFMLTLYNSQLYSDPGDDPLMEICRVTSVSGDVFTVVRAQEGTTAIGHDAGITVGLFITAGTFDETFDQNLKTSDSVGFAQVDLDNLSGDKVLISSGTTVVESSVTIIELGYLNGVTGAIQDQLDDLIPLNYLDTDPTLAADSDSKIATQKATKSYVDTSISALNFVDLQDVPSSYSGQGDKFVRVKSDETGLDFVSGVETSIGIGDPIDGGISGYYLMVDDDGNLGQVNIDSMFLSVSGGAMSGSIVMGANNIGFSEIADPTPPAAGSVILFAKSDSGTTKMATIDSAGSVTILGSGGGGGAVDSVFGRTGIVVAATNDYTWAQINKATSDIADITTRSHTSLTDIGTNTHPQIDSHIASTSNPHSVTAAQTGAVALTGAETIDGLKTFSTIPQWSLAPTVGNDAVNKTYVDSVVTSGARFVGAARAATTTALATNTYSNGASGVGATITKSTNGALTAIDGVTLIVGDIILVKNEASGLKNGLYIVTDLGSVSTKWVLTRATIYDTTSEIVEGTFFNIISGTVNANTQWRLTTTGTVTVGTTALTYDQSAQISPVTASNGLTASGFNIVLGGTLTANTSINQGAFNLTHNLDGTGDFIIQDAGVNVFQVDDTGFTRIGSAATNLGQLAIQPISAATRALVIRGAASQTGQLFLIENSAGADLAAFSSAGKFTSALTSVNDTTTHFNLSQTAIIHQQQSNTGTFFALTTLYSAVKFTASSAYLINTIGAYLRASGTISNPTATLTAYIYSDVAGAPGVNLDTAQSVRIGGITTAVGGTKYQFGSLATTTVASTDYWIVFRFSALPTGANIEWQGAATGTNIFATSSNGTAWTTVSSVSPRYTLEGPTGIGLSVVSPNNIAGSFNSINTTAISAASTNGTAGAFTSVNGIGISATSTYGTAISGSSTSGTAILSATTSGSAIVATSTTGTGLSATTTSGVGATITSTTGTSLTVTTASGIGMIVTANPATTNVTHEMMRITRNTSGVASAGIGSALNFYLEDGIGSSQLSGGFDFILTDVTNGAEDSVIAFRTRNNGTVAERARLDNTGKFNAVQLESTTTTGTAPMVVASTTVVTNLNADLLDGYNASAFQLAGNYITALTGDITAAGPGSVAATLATVNSNVGSFGSATQVATFTVNAKGLITAASNTTIAITSSAVSDFSEAAQDAVGGIVVGTGDVPLAYSDGTPSISASLSTTGVSAASYGSATQVATFTVDDKGRISTASSVSIAIGISAITMNTARLLGRTTASSGAVEEMTISSPLILSSGALSIQDAAADGTTKGAATFAAADFDASSGVISIDYTNGQAASGSTKGFLTSTDWNTFNGKQAGDATLTALAALDSTAGILVQTAADTFTKRTLTGTADQISISNDTGAAGNPTFSLPQSIATTSSPTFAAISIDGNINAGLSSSILWVNRNDELDGVNICVIQFGQDDIGWITNYPAQIYWTENDRTLNFFYGDGTYYRIATGDIAAATITANAFIGDGSGITGISVSSVSGTLPLANGGTSASLTASNGGIFYSTASAGAILAGTATANKMLLSGSSAAPVWSTSTIPTSAGTAGKILVSDGTNYVLSTPTFPNASATAGKMIRSDGTNWLASSSTFADTYTANAILYASNTNTVTGLTVVATGALVTNNTGVPSLTSGSTANRLLRTDGTTVSFAQVALATDVSGTLPVANGGSGATTLTGMLVGNGTGAFTAITSSTTGQIPRVTGANTFAFGALDLANTSAVTGILAPANGGSGTSTVFTAGSIIFAGASGVYTQDNASLFFDNTNNFLGLNNTSPKSVIHVGNESTTLTNRSPMMSVSNVSSLGSTINSAIYNSEFSVGTSNTSRLMMYGYRRAAGSDWQTAGLRWQLAVDNSFTTYNTGKAYIEFYGGNSGEVYIGTGGTDRVTVNASGVTVNALISNSTGYFATDLTVIGNTLMGYDAAALWINPYADLDGVNFTILEFGRDPDVWITGTPGGIYWDEGVHEVQMRYQSGDYYNIRMGAISATSLSASIVEAPGRLNIPMAPDGSIQDVILVDGDFAAQRDLYDSSNCRLWVRYNDMLFFFNAAGYVEV